MIWIAYKIVTLGILDLLEQDQAISIIDSASKVNNKNKKLFEGLGMRNIQANDVTTLVK